MMKEKRSQQQQQQQQQLQHPHQPEATYANVGPDGESLENIYCNIDEVRQEGAQHHRYLSTAHLTRKQSSLPIQQQQQQQQLPPPPPYRGRNASGTALSDRPDSGFDSNRELESRVMTLEEAEVEDSGSTPSSPEAAEISRQAAIRQPVFRKRRMNNMQ